MRTYANLRHKNLTNTIINTLLTITVITVAGILYTNTAFAFSLPTQFTPVLETPVAPEKLSYSYSSGSVLSSASPITTAGAWKDTSAKPVPIVRTGNGLVLEGMASYYSKAGCLGCNPLFVMANGQQLDDNALTIAIGADRKHLVGYNARVTSLATGKSVIVRITDTGGFYQDKYGNRIADMTIGTKTAIGITGGLGRIRLEVL